MEVNNPNHNAKNVPLYCRVWLCGLDLDKLVGTAKTMQRAGLGILKTLPGKEGPAIRGTAEEEE